jgi:hypothetical protein
MYINKKNGKKITDEEFEALTEAKQSKYELLVDSPSKDDEIAADLAHIVARPSQTRSPFVDTLPKTPFYLKRQFEQKVNPDHADLPADDPKRYKNTFGVLAFPTQVEAEYRGVKLPTQTIMQDLSELRNIAETESKELFLPDGKINPGLWIEIKNGTPVLIGG